jgi:hypothetical protein
VGSNWEDPGKAETLGFVKLEYSRSPPREEDMKSHPVPTLCLTLLLTSVAIAQEHPRTEVFGGYSYKRQTGSPRGQVTTGRNGWELSSVTRLYPGVQFEGALLGDYGVEDLNPFFMPEIDANLDSVEARTRDIIVVGGPRFALPERMGVSPYVHALAGVLHQRIDRTLVYNPNSTTPLTGTRKDSLTDTVFALVLGGGLDFRLTDRVHMRVIQIDYVRAKLGTNYSGRLEDDTLRFRSNLSTNNIRLSVGLKLRF